MNDDSDFKDDEKNEGSQEEETMVQIDSFKVDVNRVGGNLEEGQKLNT